jgi:hypothetical protein
MKYFDSLWECGGHIIQVLDARPEAEMLFQVFVRNVDGKKRYELIVYGPEQ